MSSEKGLSKKTVEKLLSIMTDAGDKAHKNPSVHGGVIGNVVDDCRRLLAEAARSEGMENLDRFYGREPAEERAESAQSIFDIHTNFSTTRHFPRKEKEVHVPDSSEPTRRST